MHQYGEMTRLPGDSGQYLPKEKRIKAPLYKRGFLVITGNKQRKLTYDDRKKLKRKKKEKKPDISVHSEIMRGWVLSIL